MKNTRTPQPDRPIIRPKKKYVSLCDWLKNFHRVLSVFFVTNGLISIHIYSAQFNYFGSFSDGVKGKEE